MSLQQNIGLFNHLTYKGNLKNTRYGWLRLTPAYSVHLVSDLLDIQAEENSIVLDPFCGTGTTALVCAEKGIESHTTDINPFLIWLATTKTRLYTKEEILTFEEVSNLIVNEMIVLNKELAWIPPLHQIEKWWDQDTLLIISYAMRAIKNLENKISQNISDLLKINFCRMVIERANVSFRHQSMSFKKDDSIQQLSLLGILDSETVQSWKQAVLTISKAAYSHINYQPQVILCDARQLKSKLKQNYYTHVITSPPYPNRMSYIRELRPYMYWLGYLENARDAGELDWQSIGGTWGCATSNLTKWKPEKEIQILFDGFEDILNQISQKSFLLSQYVRKYFYDMLEHCREIFSVVKPGGVIYYVVGNSKFYDVILPVESIFASLFESVGFVNVTIRTLRKRTSKKELFEFVVSGNKPI
jgi:DNA modification methylase